MLSLTPFIFYSLFSLSTSLVIPSTSTKVIANVTIPNTPIVRAAQAYARQHSSDFVYKHIMRSWLFGVLLIQANSTLRATIDMEIHAVATILHDLGWDRTPHSHLISSDRRFEVDGAIAAVDFIRHHHDGRGWEDRRVQLVWDAIALHTERSIAYFKEAVVQVVSRGISLDFTGPGMDVSKNSYEAVVREFPKQDLKAGVNETIVWLCQTKPATTYGKESPSLTWTGLTLRRYMDAALGREICGRLFSTREAED